MKGPIAVPFTSKTWLLMERGMTGATGNYYCGLHEFEDMAFVLHLLRPGDIFVDIGSNIGSYTLLASGHVGAFTIAVEPLPTTFRRLRTNVRFNDIEHLVTLFQCGIGEAEATLRFTATLDTISHVISDSDRGLEFVEVPVIPLDKLVGASQPICMKIDVEGFEQKVIDGGSAVFQSPSLRAVLMELNGSGNRYGFDDEKIHQRMLEFGFQPFQYDPMSRELQLLQDRNESSGNTLYLRDIAIIRERLKDAPNIELPWRKIPRIEVLSQE